MARGEERILNRYLIETAGSRRDAFVLSMRKSAPPPAGSALSALYGYDDDPSRVIPGASYSARYRALYSRRLNAAR